MKKALVIGAAGFVGDYLVSCLKNEFSMEVFATKLEKENYSSENASVLNLNILDKEQVTSVLKKTNPDYIFHLAAQSSVSASWANPQLTVDINVKGTLNLLGSLKELESKARVLLVGSGEEYGAPSGAEDKIDENSALHPENIYAATKACQNMLGAIYAKAYGLEIVNVRAFNHIGPGQRETFVVSDFCKQVARIEKGLQEPVIYVGNLSAYRDFSDVRDIVRAYALLALSGKKGETYNVGSGKAVQIQAILDRILSLSKAKIKVEVDQKKFRPVDVPKIEPDISKIQKETGWQPKYDIDETIQDVLDWWRMRG